MQPAFSLQLLPQVFLLQSHAASSVDTAPRSAEDAVRKDAAWQLLQDTLSERQLHCRDFCPCVQQQLADTVPEQGFHMSWEEL